MLHDPYSNFTDLELLYLVRDSNNSAFDEIYERHWLSLYNIAYKRLKDRELAKDLVQDIFVDLWDKRNIKQILALQPYLHTAVRYKVYTLLTKKKITPHFIEPFEAMACSPFGADSHLGGEELEKLLNRWLQKLPPKRGEIFKLRFMEDLSTKEISTKLNIPQKTVQNQLNLARHDLKEYLGYFSIIIAVFGSL